MIARGKPQFALRPYLPQDTPFLAEIFRASVEGLTEDESVAAVVQLQGELDYVHIVAGTSASLGGSLAFTTPATASVP